MNLIHNYLTAKMSSTNATSAAAIAAKNAFLIDIKEQLSINFANENNKTFEGMKMRLKSANTIAKILNKRLTSVFDTLLALNASASNGRLLSTFYLKMHEMITDSLNCHRRDYINGEKHILKVKDYALRLNKNARKCMDIVYNLMSKINDKRDIPSYDEIISNHNTFNSNYWLRQRKPVNYIEDEDSNFDDASDEDYVDEDEVVESNNIVGRPKRNIPRVDYTGMDEENDDIFDYDYVNDDVEDDDEDDELDFCVDDDDEDEYNVDDAADEQFVSDYLNDPDYIDTENADDSNDDDSEYIPSDDEESDDDHVLEFDDDDYAEESEEDDDDYEDEDELRKDDLEFLNDYHNDSDYKVENVENDDDSEYIPDAEDELEDDHILNFDDHDYAEESEEEDDDYEDSETDDVEDKKFVSDYFNDPDYEPNENVEEDNIELEYDFNFKQNANVVKQKKSNDLVLKGGIEEDEDYNPEDDCEDEDDEEVMYACMNKNENKVSVCKRFYDRQSERVHYRWITMTKAEFDNKYDEEYTEENV